MESATQTLLRDAMGDDALTSLASDDTGHGSWSKDQMLTAQVIDLLGQLIHVQVSRAGVDSKPPQPYPRPGVKRVEKQKVSDAGLAYLQRIRDERRTKTE